ncbi:MAG: methyltransferase domain-containing protein [Deltaproteobacteria bacterium]|nr:methyltransferase domain-containing protein [Deltaproteobacteria bacterium]
MNPTRVDQRRQQIKTIRWYHEFDLPNGLQIRSREPDTPAHQRLWRAIFSELEAIDFEGKTVLDIGCWDGMFSFFAERRGAKEVVAADDYSQNWSTPEGIRLVRDVLNSSIKIVDDMSIYQVAKLQQKFDIILCFGVYYHLADPFFAFANLRHCAHPGSWLFLEGDVLLNGGKAEADYHFGRSGYPCFLPSEQVLRQMLEAAYLRVEDRVWLDRPRNPILTLMKAAGRKAQARALLKCRPFHGVNDCHDFKPPFGLDQYDDRSF